MFSLIPALPAKQWLLPALVAVVVVGSVSVASIEVYPAWYYRIRYFTTVRVGPQKLAAARRMTRRHLFFNPRHVVLLDMSQSSAAPRLGVYELRTGRCVFRTRVMHGQGSGRTFASTFSNRDGSLCTALGRYVVVRAYYGDFGRAYRLAGLDDTNDNALSRSIVLHSSPSVRPGHIGRSNGCPAVSAEALRLMRPWLRPGTLLWIYQ